MSDNTRDDDYYPDDENYIDEPPSRKKPVDLGNTLDYYNDDMSRKAVGKLFDDVKSSDSKERDDEYIESQSDARPQEESPEDDYGVVRGFDKPAAPPRRPPARPEPSSFDDVDDDDYAFALYRKKTPRKPAVNPERSRPVPPPEMEAKPKPARAAVPPQPKQPPQHAPRTYHESRSEPTKIERPVRTPYQNVVKTPPARPTPTRRPAYRDEDDFDDYGAPALPTRLIVIGGVLFIVVLLLATLVFQLSSARAKLKQANEEITAMGDIELRYSQLSMEKETLAAENETLKQQLEEANKALESSEDTNPQNSQNIPSSGTTPSGTTAGGSTTGNSTTGGTTPPAGAGYTNYTVVQGDTLGKISNKFYGNISGVSRIQEANGLTGTDIGIGQVLKIPQ